MRVIEDYIDIVVNDELVLYARFSGKMYPVKVYAILHGRIHLACKNHEDLECIKESRILDHSTGQSIIGESYLVYHYRMNPRCPNVIDISHPNRLWNWEDLGLFTAIPVQSEQDTLIEAIRCVPVEKLQVLGIDRLRHVAILLGVNPFGDEERCTKETNNE